MKKRTSRVSRRIVSLLMSMVLTLTLVTPAAFATEVVDGSGTTIVEGNTNPADANPNEDAEGGDNEDEDGKDEQPTEPDDEDKEPSEDDEIIAGEEDADDGDIYDVQEDTLLGVSLYAAKTWDGTSDTTWYVGHEEDTKFEISTAAQLAGLAELVNAGTDFSGKTIALTADIQLNEQDVPVATDEYVPNSWNPIGSKADNKAFAGTLNGQGHTISGLYISSTEQYQGLIGYVTAPCIVKDLIVKGYVASTAQNGKANNNVGGIAVCAKKALVQNCGFYGNVIAGSVATGGVAGGAMANTQNCWYYYTGDTPNYKIGVTGRSSTNCYTNVNKKQAGTTIVTVDQFKGASADKNVVDMLNANLPDGCKEWVQGVEYPMFTVPLATWDGTSDTAWYVGHEEDTKFEISTAAQLAGLAELVNAGTDFSGKTIALTADIQLNEQDVPVATDEYVPNSWNPIGSKADNKAFAGTLNGQGHTISGLYISSTEQYQGLIGYVTAPCIVKDLIVKGYVASTAQNGKANNNVGGIAVCAKKALVQNCGFYGNVIAGSVATGGVAGGAMANTQNCWYYYTGDTPNYKIGVTGRSSTNCYTNVNKKQAGTTIVTVDQFKGASADKNVVDMLNANLPDGCKEWVQGAEYPVFASDDAERANKTVTLIPLFPDYSFTVSIADAKYDEEKGAYTVGANIDSVDLIRSDNENELWVSTKADGTEASAIDPSKGYPIPNARTTLYYGTKDDFDTMAAWNSVMYNNITTEGQLKALARMVNSGKDSMEGKRFALQKDITLTGNWTPIGTAANPFKGSFNGSYFTVSGLKIDDAYPDAGLFGVVEMGSGKIQWLTVTGSVKSASGNANIGGIVGHMVSGTVENCLSLVDVAGSGSDAVIGGVVGKNDGTVQKCASGTSKAVPAVGSGTAANCFYLADTSTFGTENSANGARTAEEFAAGRVTWELNGGKASLKKAVTWGMKDNMPAPVGSSKIGPNTINGRVYELTLTKAYAPDGKDIALTGSTGVAVFHNGDTWYAYCIGDSKKTFNITVDSAGIGKGNAVAYGTNGKPEKIKFITDSYLGDSNDATANTYYYTISKTVKEDTSWYTGDGPYKLSDVADLFGFAKLVNEGNDFAGKTVELTGDIDLSGYVWMPVGNRDERHFDGTFNGNSHSITNMDVNTAGYGYAGLFGNVNGGIVQNVRVEGSITAQNTSYVGGIVGYTNGTVENCLSEVAVTSIGGSAAVGGVVGRAKSIDLCSNMGEVEAQNGYVGGVVGQLTDDGIAQNCANLGTVKGDGMAFGGIAGNGAVANSYNHGDVTAATAKGISGIGAVTNSYYVCKLNGVDEMFYVNTSETSVTLAADGKTYMAGDAKLVDVLNGSRGNYELWFINFEKNVFLPRHATKWDGETDTDCTFKTITVTYNPNGGVNKDGNNTAVTVSEMVYVVGEDVAVPAQHIVLSVDAEALGFKHENGTFDSWKDNNGASHIAGDILTGITENITLTAQWHNIWVGTGTEADPYQIPSIDELTKLQEQVNGKGFDYKDKWFKLTGSIDMSNVNWVPIAGFGGNLDGNHCTIRGLNVNVASGYAGLFGSTSYSTFQDLTLESPMVTGNYYCGSLVGYGWGTTLINITAKNVAVSSTGRSAGGLAGCGVMKAENCVVEGGSVTACDRAAGIGTADSDNSPEIINCHNSANIKTTTAWSSSRYGIAAGIWACDIFGAGGTFTGCTNSGTVSGQSYAAGIATAASAIKNCVNRGNVTSSDNLAGGVSNNATWISYCGNTGTITGRGSTISREGIAGINSSIYGNVEFCYNTGVIVDSTGNPNRIYGIAAGVIRNCRLKNCFSYVKDDRGEIVDIPLISNIDIDGNVTNSYYLASSATAVSSAGTWASADDFTSGKVAWGVDGGTGAHANYWTQGANNYPVPIGEGTSTSYYRAKAECGTGGAVSIKSSRDFTGDADNAVYGPKGMSVTVTATPKDNTFGLKSLTLDLMGTGSTTALESGDSFILGEANALVVAAFASTGNGGSDDGTGGNGGDGDGTGTDTGDGAGDENDEGLQDGLNLEVEYDVKGLVLAAYGAWGAEGSGKTFAQWLKDSPEVLRALITNSLDNMAVAAMGKKTDEAKDLAALLLASLNEHSGLDGQSSDIIGKALRRYIESGTEAAFSAWLTTGGGMASGTYESIFAQYTNSLLALTDRLYTSWESSGTSLTFPQWLDAQQVSMESLSENAEEPDAEPDDTQTTEAPEDVPDGQEAEGGASSGGNSVWEVIGTVVRENPIIVWSIVAVIAALVIVGAVRRYHKVKRDEHDDAVSKK